jgi:thiol:disulfide interchange protein DsbD
LFLVFLALAAWIFGEFVQRGPSGSDAGFRALWRAITQGEKLPKGGFYSRNGAIVILAALLITSYVVILEGHLKWRSPTAPETTATVAADPQGIQWQPWSAQAVAAARAEGRPVLVDFTAKWCLTCNTIVKPALENRTVRDKIKQANAVALLGDYTSFPPAITDELNRLGRAGVPVVLVYPKDSTAPPMVYDVVTSSTVVDALDRAAR